VVRIEQKKPSKGEIYKEIDFQRDQVRLRIMEQEVLEDYMKRSFQDDYKISFGQFLEEHKHRDEWHKLLNRLHAIASLRQSKEKQAQANMTISQLKKMLRNPDAKKEKK